MPQTERARPSPFADDDDACDVPEASGAYLNCDCSWCGELRLRDEDRISFGAWDLAQAYGAGWVDGRRER